MVVGHSRMLMHKSRLYVFASLCRGCLLVEARLRLVAAERPQWSSVHVFVE